MNGNCFENKVVASETARNAGYKFFLSDNKVYFINRLTSGIVIFDTGLTEEDLI